MVQRRGKPQEVEQRASYVVVLFYLHWTWLKTEMQVFVIKQPIRCNTKYDFKTSSSVWVGVGRLNYCNLTY